jgi:hypothetical protein
MGGDEEVDDEGPDEDEIDEGDELKPGQREITPSPGNADRVFYETLLAQVSSVGRSRSCVASLRVLSIARLQFKSVRLRLSSSLPRRTRRLLVVDAITIRSLPPVFLLAPPPHMAPPPHSAPTRRWRWNSACALASSRGTNRSSYTRRCTARRTKALRASRDVRPSHPIESRSRRGATRAPNRARRNFRGLCRGNS